MGQIFFENRIYFQKYLIYYFYPVSKMICLTFFLNICIMMMYSLEYTYWLVQSKHPCRFIRGCFFCPKKQIKGGDMEYNFSLHMSKEGTLTYEIKIILRKCVVFSHEGGKNYESIWLCQKKFVRKK